MKAVSHWRFRLWILLTLTLLGMTGFAALLFSGIAVTLVVNLVLLSMGASIDSVVSVAPYLIGSSSVAVLSMIAWGERNAPVHTVEALGATQIDEPATSDVMAIVRQLSLQLDVPTPTLYVAPTDSPISLVTGFRASETRLVLSAGLLNMLDKAELKAVIAHELSHVKNNDVAVMTAAALPVEAAERIRNLFTGPTAGIEHGVVSRADYADAILTVSLVLIAPLWLISVLLAASFARTREFAADRAAVTLTGEPAALTRALERIDGRIANQPTTDFRRSSVAAFAIVEPHSEPQDGLFQPLYTIKQRLFSTHPPIEGRLRRLR